MKKKIVEPSCLLYATDSLIALFFLFQPPCFLLSQSPNKSEFIKAKYQMLAFVHRMPCREDDSLTAKDLSKVSRTITNAFA